MDRKTDALLNLLQDDDEKIATIAMEQLLSDEKKEKVSQLIRENQDSQDPSMRFRVHQLASIQKLRSKRKNFIQKLRKGHFSLFTALAQLCCLSDFSLSETSIKKEFLSLVKRLPKGTESIQDITAFLREESFLVPDEYALENNFLLLDKVLNYHFGSPVILASLAHFIAKSIKCKTSIALVKGSFCLIHEKTFANPLNMWKIKKIPSDGKAFVCKERDIILNVISQLFIISCRDGIPHEIFLYGSLLSEFSNMSYRKLPYPLGNAKHTVNLQSTN